MLCAMGGLGMWNLFSAWGGHHSAAPKSVDQRMEDVQRFTQLAAIGLCALSLLFALSQSGSGTGSSAAGGSDGTTMLVEIGKSLGATLRVFALSIAALAAAAAAGALSGFLFGIPRLLQRLAPGNPAETRPEVTGPAFADLRNGGNRSVVGNSNLEDISDWLTKIIVGLALVHLETIITKLFALVDFLAKGSGTETSAFQPFLFCLLLAGFVLSFLSVYLETRTRLTSLFSDTETLLDGKTQTAMRESNATPILRDERGDTTRNAQAAVNDTDRALLGVPIEQLRGADEFAAWASAQARAGNLLPAAQAMTTAITRAPERQDLLLRLADIRRLQENVRGEVDALQEALRKGPQDLAVQLRLVLALLYLPAPESFQRAIVECEKLMLAGHVNNPAVQLYYASAQGQRASWLNENKRNDTDSDYAAEFADARTKALDAVRRVIALAPDPTSGSGLWVRQIFDPAKFGGQAGENDLEVFKADPEFQALLAPAAP